MTQNEHMVLVLMFELMDTIITHSEGFYTLPNGEYFTLNDLWELKQKLAEIGWL